MPIEISEFTHAVGTRLDEYVLRGGICMALLIPLSIFTLGVIIQRFLDLRRTSVVPPGLVETARAVKGQDEFAAFRDGLITDGRPLAHVLLSYIEAGERGEPFHPDINREPIEDTTDRLYQSLTPLSTAYVIAPLLGVLGTTIAIMGTFKQFAIAGQRDMTALVLAIDQSLVSTMWGLFIAVPAYYCFSVMQRRVFHYERHVLPALSKDIIRKLAPFIRLREDDLLINGSAEPRRVEFKSNDSNCGVS
jgi:biopolymer transport protein ExbB